MYRLRWGHSPLGRRRPTFANNPVLAKEPRFHFAREVQGVYASRNPAERMRVMRLINGAMGPQRRVEDFRFRFARYAQEISVSRNPAR